MTCASPSALMLYRVGCKQQKRKGPAQIPRTPPHLGLGQNGDAVGAGARRELQWGGHLAQHPSF